MNETGWRKSTYSSNGGASCIEVGQAIRIIAVRDKKQHGRGPVLRFTPVAWRRFADQVKRSLASEPELTSTGINPGQSRYATSIVSRRAGLPGLV
jgi:hypothetical protein